LYHELNRVLETPGRTAKDAAAVIERDPALTTRLLALVNSSFFGLRRRVSTVAHAITMVGLRELRHLVLATEVLERFRGIGSDLEDMGSFWRQSLACALLCRRLEEAAVGNEESGLLFTVGLLHRVGDLIIFRRAPELARQALLRHRDNGLPLWEAEQTVMGFDHGDVGAKLAELWQFPSIMVELLRFQQRPKLAPTHPRLCAILYLAVNTVHEEMLPPAAAPCWTLAGTTPEALGGLKTEILNQAAEIAKIYGLPS
ncbi:MAG TPA: HDOD domain-containing protein, partial [Desulfurivibrio alkaliphilus]|nr:HDOD domain-containing protein [Desulfurivibrio alkaliphilus]